MRLLVIGLAAFLLVGLVTGCGSVSAPAPTVSVPVPTLTEVGLQAPEIDFTTELKAAEPIMPDLGEIDVIDLELPLDQLVDSIDVGEYVSPSLDSFDLSLSSNK